MRFELCKVVVMKVMIMTDMEGVAGITNHDEWVLRDGIYFEKGKRLLAGEINATVDGLFAGGATEVVVFDGHGQRGIDPELLDPRALLMVCINHGIWYPFGLDTSFDGICWVGQHAKSGTDYSHITHTGWFDVLDSRVNGISIGEYGEVAFCAMELGVPCIFGTGEAAFCQEAEALTPGIVTVPVKWGLKRDCYDHLTCDEYRRAKLSALHLSPTVARERIRMGAVEAMQKLREQPDTFIFPPLQPPYVREITYRRDGDHPVRVEQSEHPSSIIDLMNLPYLEVPVGE